MPAAHLGVNNFEHESLGPVDLSTAIAYSDNTVFAQLTNIVSPRAWSTRPRRWDHHPIEPYFSIGLGAEPATPLEMARAYATLADAATGSTAHSSQRAARRRLGETCRRSVLHT